MKVTMFHFMPYRDLPDSFPDKLHSAWIDAPWWEYGDANKVTDVYNWSVDELMLAAKLGFDGVGTNEHHQNPYGFMCNPNLFRGDPRQDDARPGAGPGRAAATRRDDLVLSANPACRGVRRARLPQRRTLDRRLADRPRR